MCKLEVQFIHGIYFGYRQSLRECADCTSSRAQYMPPADIAYPGLIPASSKRDFYSLAVVLFELLCGPDNHPYLTRQQRQRCHSVNHNTDVRLRMASWTRGARRHVSPALIGLIESMLRRDSGRAGMTEVGVVSWGSCRIVNQGPFLMAARVSNPPEYCARPCKELLAHLCTYLRAPRPPLTLVTTQPLNHSP